MKTLNKTLIGLTLFLCSLTTALSVSAQDTLAQPVVKLHYFASNNNIQYLSVETVTKSGKKWKPLPKQTVTIFLDSNSAENLISKTSTDETGKSTVVIQPRLQSQWNNGSKHNFIAVLDENSTTLEITKAKIVMDTVTADGIRTINVKIMFLENNAWVPASDVELKIGVSRSGSSILSAGEEGTYTTDSTGAVSVEFKRDSLPGDEKGNLTLLAKVEDNELYGNLLIEKKVPWGSAFVNNGNFFDQRTLWSTRFRTPLWLLAMAYGILIIVWGTIIYLVLQIVRIKKLGNAV
ncbi:MAG: hypothetical protein ABJA78_09925 [Ferruginibacter sp.]